MIHTQSTYASNNEMHSEGANKRVCSELQHSCVQSAPDGGKQIHRIARKLNEAKEYSHAQAASKY